MPEKAIKEKDIQVRERRPLTPQARTDEFERFFDLAMRPFGLISLRGFRRYPALLEDVHFTPDIDVFEQNGNLVVRADLPGMKREDIEVAVEGDMLVIRGQRKEEKEIKKEDYYCSERAVGEFSRAIRLPEGIEAESISAKYTDGVLEVTMPRPSAPKPETVKVQLK